MVILYKHACVVQKSMSFELQVVFYVLSDAWHRGGMDAVPSDDVLLFSAVLQVAYDGALPSIWLHVHVSKTHFLYVARVPQCIWQQVADVFLWSHNANCNQQPVGC